ncbi:MAG: preprotein translocase subunit SecY [Nanoarchaeota archaeon]
MGLQSIIYNLPEVKKPIEKKLSFNKKLKWTIVVLLSFFILANISLYGVSAGFLERFDFLEVILGTDFGSIISLGIGPIVMASIILQLLVGAGIMNIDTKSEEGKKQFQGLQKLGVLFFIIFEAVVYVLMKGIEASPGFTGVVIFQLVLGGLVIMFLDEVSQKWGFGSGVSLFIAAGVAWRLFTSLFQFMGVNGEICLFDLSNTPCAGKVLVIIQSILNNAPTELYSSVAAILFTVLIFLGVVWAQNLKVEIPLSYERLRGYGVKWPLQFFYASNIPVILVAALAANIQLFGGLLENWLGRPTFLGSFSQGAPVSGFAYWIGSTNIIEAIIRGSFQKTILLQSLTHLIFYMGLSAIFAVFWVKTSGMDEASQAKNILSSGLQIPGFRKDPRVLESILARYIMPLTIMGGLAIGAFSSIADLLGALTSGTSILLAVMIMYQFYTNIAQQHALDMHPALRKMMG